jgi:hypothetical protein
MYREIRGATPLDARKFWCVWIVALDAIAVSLPVLWSILQEKLLQVPSRQPLNLKEESLWSPVSRAKPPSYVATVKRPHVFAPVLRELFSRMIKRGSSAMKRRNALDVTSV